MQHQDAQGQLFPSPRFGDWELKAAASVATLSGNIPPAAPQQDAVPGHLQAEPLTVHQTRREILTWVQNRSGGSPQVMPAGSTLTVT